MMLSLAQATKAIKGAFKPEEQPPPPAGEAPPAREEEEAAPTGAAAPEAGVPPEQMFDELFSAPIYKASDFEELVHGLKREERGTTRVERLYWSHPRRWKVVLWDVKLQNHLAGDTMNAFVEFDIGGTRQEVRVEVKNRTRIYVYGDLKLRLRTTVGYGIKGGDRPVDINYRTVAEYRGSYLDVEEERVKIKVWTYSPYRVNCLEGLHEERLESYAAGPIYREHDLYKAVGGKRVPRCRVSFQLIFQEIYDFQLVFSAWRIFGFQTGRELEWQLEQQRRPVRAEGPAARLQKGLQREDEPLTPPSETAPATSAAEKSKEAARAECAPRLVLTLRSQTTYNKDIQLTSSILRDNVRPSWKSLGTVYFRGTISELESATLQVSVLDFKRARPKQCVSQVTVPLQGVVDYAYLRATLSAPGWLARQAKAEGWGSVVTSAWSFGSVEGKIAIANTPRHRQTGNAGNVDVSRVNLCVLIKKVEPVVTLEDRKDVKPFVQVSFDGDSRSTRVIPGATTPEFNELLIIPMQLPDKLEVLQQDLESKGKISIDVWSREPSGNEHCGGLSFALAAICFDAKGHQRERVPMKVVQSETGLPIRHVTRRLTQAESLQFVFGTVRASQLSFTAWTMPDLLEYAAVSRFARHEDVRLPRSLLDRLPDYEETFDSVCTDLTAASEFPRFFYCYALDQWLNRHLVPTFCGKIVPPKGVDNAFIIAHYIRSIRFTSVRVRDEASARLKGEEAAQRGALQQQQLSPEHTAMRVWSTPEFTLMSRAGSIMDHVLLHVSLLIGLSIQAFVCVGTLWSEAPHAWVCTFHYDTETEHGFVRFWESTTAQVFVLPHRFKDRQIIRDVFAHGREEEQRPTKKKGAAWIFGGWAPFAGRQPKEEVEIGPAAFWLEEEDADQKGRPAAAAPRLPYRSLDMVFNHLNIWVNKQEPNPGKIWFDLWRAGYWHQFSLEHHDIKPCFLPRAVGTVPSHSVVAALKEEIVDRCQNEIGQFRASRHLGTRWNRDADLQRFLELGLELLYASETTGEDDRGAVEGRRDDWKQTLYGKVPRSWRLRALPLHFNQPNSKMIADTVVQRCDFLECRERSSTFALSVFLKPLPGDLISIYILVVLLHRVTERERRRYREREDKAKRDTALKRLTRKRRRRREATFTGYRPTELQALIAPLALGMEEEGAEVEALEPTTALEAAPPSITARAPTMRIPAEALAEAPPLRALTIKPSVVVPLKLPKKKRRKFDAPPGSHFARLVLTSNAPMSGPYANPDRFRDLLETVEDCLSEGLRIPRRRIKAYECLYREGVVGFAILPSTGRSQETPAELLAELETSIPDIVRDSPKLLQLTGGTAVIEPKEEPKPVLKQAEPEQRAARVLTEAAVDITKKKQKKELPKPAREMAPPAAVPSPIPVALPSTTPIAEVAPIEEEADQAAAREQFYVEMRQADPETFDKLLEYYIGQGHPRDHATYFAAYYTAVKVHQPAAA